MEGLSCGHLQVEKERPLVRTYSAEFFVTPLPDMIKMIRPVPSSSRMENWVEVSVTWRERNTNVATPRVK